jgi:hypothetical protein
MLAPVAKISLLSVAVENSWRARSPVWKKNLFLAEKQQVPQFSAPEVSRWQFPRLGGRHNRQRRAAIHR